ncbi:hypothetical protein AB0451_33335 [Streptomyces sp. NPDC052000]
MTQTLHPDAPEVSAAERAAARTRLNELSTTGVGPPIRTSSPLSS